MKDNQLHKGMFHQQRLQILHLAAHFDEFNLDYAYAWSEGIYPVTYDTDDSVLDRPHELYSNCFLLNKDDANRVFNYLCDKWDSKSSSVFDELARDFSQISEHTLIKFCRFLYMNGTFDDDFWNDLIKPGFCPGIASSIKVEPSRSSLLDY